MITFPIGFSIILLLIVLFLLFRIGTLASIFRGSSKRASGTTKTSNKVNSVLLLLSYLISTLLSLHKCIPLIQSEKRKTVPHRHKSVSVADASN